MARSLNYALISHFPAAPTDQGSLKLLFPRKPLTLSTQLLSTHLIQDSSSSMSRKNWCRRCDSLSFALREAAMFLIFWKRPLMVSRFSFTWEVSKALLVIRLSAWLFRSFRRSWGRDTRKGSETWSQRQFPENSSH